MLDCVDGYAVGGILELELVVDLLVDGLSCS